MEISFAIKTDIGHLDMWYDVMWESEIPLKPGLASQPDYYPDKALWLVVGSMYIGLNSSFRK